MTLPRAIMLRRLELGQQPYILPALRDPALRDGHIVEVGRLPGRNGGFRRQFGITQNGVADLRASKHYKTACDLAEATPAIGDPPWL